MLLLLPLEVEFITESDLVSATAAAHSEVLVVDLLRIPLRAEAAKEGEWEKALTAEPQPVLENIILLPIIVEKRKRKLPNEVQEVVDTVLVLLVIPVTTGGSLIELDTM